MGKGGDSATLAPNTIDALSIALDSLHGQFLG